MILFDLVLFQKIPLLITYLFNTQIFPKLLNAIPFLKLIYINSDN